MGFLSQSDYNLDCYGNIQLPLTYNGKNENWHLLLCHCRYSDKFLQKCSLSGPLPNVSFLSKLLNLIGCYANPFNLRKNIKKSSPRKP